MHEMEAHMLYNLCNSAKAALLITVTILTSCTPKPWNVANTTLETTAEALAATDELIAANMGSDLETAREHVVEEARVALAEWEACTTSTHDDCGQRPTVEAFMAEYYSDAEVTRWEAVTVAMEALREALIVAQTAAMQWRETQQQPDSWEAICIRLHGAQADVIRAIEVVGVDVPQQYEAALNNLSTVCAAITTTTEGSGADDE